MQQKSNSPWYSLIILLVLTLVISVIVQFILILFYVLKVGSLTDLISGSGSFDLASIQDKWYLYLLLAGGSLGTFFLPAYFLQRIEKDQVVYFPMQNQNPIMYLLVFLFLLSFSPLMGLIGEWNMNLTLPKAMESVEIWMKTQEEAMAQLTENLVMVTSWKGLMANLLVMAVIPAIVEEYYFRGVLQKIAQRIVINPHIAILITAIIFSAIHLQFYGFFPRMILGLFFGYFLLWTNNIWVPIFAHFVNNASVTIIAFYYARQGKTYQELMSMESYSIFMYIAGFIISVGAGYLIFKLSKKIDNPMEKNWTKVRTYTNEIKSELLKQLLEQNDIPTVVLNKKDSSYLFGKIEIFVSDELVAAAEPIIVAFEQQDSNLTSDEN